VFHPFCRAESHRPSPSPAGRHPITCPTPRSPPAVPYCGLLGSTARLHPKPGTTDAIIFPCFSQFLAFGAGADQIDRGWSRRRGGYYGRGCSGATRRCLWTSTLAEATTTISDAGSTLGSVVAALLAGSVAVVLGADRSSGAASRAAVSIRRQD
jgi:hypothetical protein